MEPLRRRSLPLLALAVTIAACGGDDGSSLPGVVLPAVDGFAQDAPELDTGELEGPAVLNFWATWCAPCRTELPDFQRASEQRPGVRFLGIDEGFEPGTSVEFLDELGVTYDQYVDAGGALAAKLEIAELPATIVLDAEGDVALRHLGPLNYDELIAALAEFG
jgi:cytochrome c biogenesis protein CcmG, thiol:disulfide interchange protein DsbE